MHVLLLETIAFVGATVHTFQPAPEGAAGVFAEPSVATVLVEDGKAYAEVSTLHAALTYRYSTVKLYCTPSNMDGFLGGVIEISVGVFQ